MTRYVFAGAAVLWMASSAASLTQSRPEPAAPASPRAAAPSAGSSSAVRSRRASTSPPTPRSSGQVLSHLPQRAREDRQPGARRLDLAIPAANADVWEKVVRKLRSGRCRRSACRARPSRARRSCRLSRPSLDAAPRRSPIPGARAPSAEPRRVRQRHSRSARARGRPRRCCRPTIRLRLRQHRGRPGRVAGAARTLPGGRRRSARWRSAIRSRPGHARPSACRGTSRRTSTSRACRSARAAGWWRTTPFRSTASTSSRSSCSETNLARFAGSNTRTSSRSRRRRARPSGAGRRRRGPRRSAENATDVAERIDARLSVRVPVKAGSARGGASRSSRSSAAQDSKRLQPFRRSTSTPRITRACRTSRASRSPGRSTPTGPATRRAAAASSCAVRRPAAQEPAVRAADHRDPRAARLSAAGDRRRARAAAGVLRDRPQRRRASSAASSWRCGAFSPARSSCSASSTTPTAPRRARALSRSATSSWRRGCRSSCGAASRTTSCSRGRPGQAAAARRARATGAAHAGRPARRALVTNFAGQWLQLRNLRASIRTRTSFPTSTTTCARRSAARPSCSSRASCARTAASLDLLTADYTFVNERLAQHYGIPNVYGSQFRRVPVTDEARRGLLGQGSILMVTSHADRTSPVLRGKWILDNILGTPPPPPPPNVPALEERRARTAAHAARADGGAPRQPRVRVVPQADGSAGLRARELRRRRRLADNDEGAADRRRRASSRTGRRSTAW